MIHSPRFSSYAIQAKCSYTLPTLFPEVFIFLTTRSALSRSL